MGRFISRTFAVLAAAGIFAATPAHAELVSADPGAVKVIIESRGWPAKLVRNGTDNPYIESKSNGRKFVILFMNCSDGRNCKTLQYYLGFSDASNASLNRMNQWNKEKRFARAYLDNDGDPVLEMDVDLDFNGIPRENLGETFNTWASLMDSFRDFVFND